MQVASRLGGAIAAATLVISVGAVGAGCDIFHGTSWQTLCDDEPGACSGRGGANAGGGGSSLADGSGGGGNSPTTGAGATSSVGPGGGGCPSSIEDCTTPGDDDCDGVANEDCGLILYLAFDEGTGATLLDSSGGEHHGTHDAAYVDGHQGTALGFDGATGAVVPGSATFTWGADNADFSVVYWLRVLAPPPGQWRSVLHKGASDCGIGDRTSAQFLAPDTQSIHSALSTTAVLPCAQEVIDTPELPVGIWVHVASVKQGATHSMYFDGALVGTLAIQPVVANQADFHLGKDAWYAGFVGELDELQVYSRALGEAEILQLAR